jgi:hypothetical protein
MRFNIDFHVTKIDHCDTKKSDTGKNNHSLKLRISTFRFCAIPISLLLAVYQPYWYWKVLEVYLAGGQRWHFFKTLDG